MDNSMKNMYYLKILGNSNQELLLVYIVLSTFYKIQEKFSVLSY